MPADAFPGPLLRSRSASDAREVAVLVPLAEGMTAVAIAHRLVVSTRTIHAHLRNIFRKLGVTDRLRAVLEAPGPGHHPRRP